MSRGAVAHPANEHRPPLLPLSKGFSISYNPRRNCTVYRIHYTADPDKQDPRWAQGVRSGMKRASFRREYEMDFTAPGDNPFYSEFAEKWEDHVQPLKKLIRGPVYRLWDFGRQHPACLWIQVSKTLRVWVIREVLATDMNIWNFRDLIRYLSGQVSLQYLVANRPQAKRYLSELGRDRSTPRFRYIPKPPWFSPTTHFKDLAGYEAEQGSDRAHQEDAGVSRAQVLAQAGIYLQTYQSGIQVSTETISQLCLEWPDGAPGLLVDPACPLFLEGMKGGICYPRATKSNPVPTTPLKDGYYEHLHDCLRYGVSQLIPVDKQGNITRPDHAFGTGKRKPKRREMVLFENRDRWGKL